MSGRASLGKGERREDSPGLGRGAALAAPLASLGARSTRVPRRPQEVVRHRSKVEGGLGEYSNKSEKHQQQQRMNQLPEQRRQQPA